MIEGVGGGDAGTEDGRNWVPYGRVAVGSREINPGIYSRRRWPRLFLAGTDRGVFGPQAVNEFLSDIEAPNPVPCGISLGGAITQQLLMDFPQRYSAGILIGTGVQMKVGPIIFEAIENDFSEFVDMLGKLAASKKTNPE